MNKECKKWFKQLQSLKAKQKKYHSAYRTALKIASKNPESRDTIFFKCQSIKSEIKPLIFELQQNLSTEPEFKRFVKRLKLSADVHENEVLQELVRDMVSKEKFASAVATARELDPSIVLPGYREVIKNVIALGPEVIKELVDHMYKPEVIIVPDMALRQICRAMDAHLHYQGKEFNASPSMIDESIKWSGKRGKVKVSIVETTQTPTFAPPEIKKEEYVLGEADYKQQIWKSYFEEKGLRLMKDYEYAVAMQKSLKEFKEAEESDQSEPRTCILDCHPPAETYLATILHPLDENSDKVPVGFFETTMGQVIFENVKDDDFDILDNMYGRGAIEIM